ncbi:hypothetical protein [Streptomyces sp. RerS4]|uniref:hypothetical protein n=1 Tax=Streptomyces sp. RerS4 TaxID=2942449 RepID=UPI00201C1216|nr:hypothetical protein [Streptomyces sp. RerS4]UQX05291.1 hypothetical protein M4D82_08330 [Streptomyces sp. RerS4]
MSATTHTPRPPLAAPGTASVGSVGAAASVRAGRAAARRASRPVRAVRRTPSAVGGASTRLHWWTLALPALAFGLLLLLLAGSGEAQAASGEAPSGLVHVSRQLLRAVG